ncbi:MAG: hypothetical protein WC595_01915 [Candidatus Nanoarchaeia archaeon]
MIGKRGQASPWEKFLGLLGRGVRILSFMFIVVVMIATVVIIWNQVALGRGSQAVTHADVLVEQSGAPALSRILGTQTYNALFNPNSLNVQYGFESEIDNAAGKKVGIYDMKLEQNGRPYYNEQIEVLGRFTASSVLEDLELVVDCQLGEGEIIPAVDVSAGEAQGNTAFVPKGSTETITATCKFPKGLNPDQNRAITTTSPGIITENKVLPTFEKITPAVASEKVTMYIRYPFPGVASYKTYLLDKDTLKKLRTRNPPLDPFDYFGVVEPQLKADNSIKSQATPGPLNVGIGAYTTQPFVQNTPQAFAITLTNNLGEWHGNLKKLESLNVNIPPYFRLESDAEYGATTQVTCPFEFTGEIDPEGFRVYSLKEKVLADMNKECSKESLKSTTLTVKECIDIFGADRDKMFSCKFKYSGGYSRMVYDFIHADVKYIYQTTQFAAVQAYKDPLAAVS